MYQLEDCLDRLQCLPQAVADRLDEMRKIDLQVDQSMKAIAQNVDILFSKVDNINPNTFDQNFKEIMEKGETAIQQSGNKIEIANSMQELLTKYVKHIDNELHSFKMELEDKYPGSVNLIEKRISDSEENHQTIQIENKFRLNKNLFGGEQDIQNSGSSKDIITQPFLGFETADINAPSKILNSEKNMSNLKNYFINPRIHSTTDKDRTIKYYVENVNNEVTEYADSTTATNEVTECADSTMVTNEATEYTDSTMSANEITEYVDVDSIMVTNEVTEYVDVDSIMVTNEVTECADSIMVTNEGTECADSIMVTNKVTEYIDVDSTMETNNVTEYIDVDSTMVANKENNLNEPRYCICNEVSYGTMVGCDNEKCPYEWFHIDCVGIIKPPKGKWYCTQCTKKKENKRKRRK